tara:strand:+ start:1518 stop:1760 length:243 start_codon:yes stop_codon:yes gene_type:complete
MKKYINKFINNAIELAQGLTGLAALTITAPVWVPIAAGLSYDEKLRHQEFIDTHIGNTPLESTQVKPISLSELSKRHKEY